MAQGTLKLKPSPPKFELLSVSKIAMRCNLDRATCKKRLDAHGYAPETEESKLKLYRFDAAMEADLTESNDKLAEVRIRKETAEAQLKEQKLAQLAGELVPIGDVVDMVQRLFGAMHKEIAVRQPKRLVGRIRKAKTPALADKAWKLDTDRVFKTLREDFEKVLG